MKTCHPTRTASRPRHPWTRFVLACLLPPLAACGGGGSTGDGPFPVTHRLDVEVLGEGRVRSTSGAIDCGRVCTTQVPVADTVTLLAEPGPDQRLISWGGDCADSAPLCELPMSRARSVSARFGRVATPPAGQNPGWTPPVSLSPPGAGVPRVALDDQGNGLAVWAQPDPGTTADSLWGARYLAETRQWSAPQRLEDLPGHAQFDDRRADLVMHPRSGRAVLVWTHQTDARVDVRARVFDPATGWNATALLEQQDGQAGAVSAGLDDAGNVLVVWSQATPRWSVWATRFVRTAGWELAQLLESNDSVGGTDGDPTIAVAGNGTAMAAWVASGHGPAINGLWSQRFTPTTGWARAERRVAATEGFARSRPAIAIDEQGRATLAWARMDVDASGAWQSMQVLRWNGQWATTPTPVGTRQPARSLLGMPFLASGPTGDTALVWSVPEARRLRIAIADRDGTWGLDSVLNEGIDGEFGGRPGVGIDTRGAVTVAWSQASPAATIHTRRRSANGPWVADTIVTSTPTAGSVAGFDAGLAVNASGQALAGWLQRTDSVGTVVQVRRFAPSP